MANVAVNLYKDKPKSCQGRNGSRSVYGRKAYEIHDFDFTEESRKAYDKRKPTHNVMINGKLQDNPYNIPMEREQRKTDTYMGKYKDSCRNEGANG